MSQRLVQALQCFDDVDLGFQRVTPLDLVDEKAKVTPSISNLHMPKNEPYDAYL